MQRYDSNTIRSDLNIAPEHQTPAVGVLVYVKLKSSGAMATIYNQDDIKGPQKENPITTDSLGNFWFYAPNNRYILEFSTGETRPDVIIFDPGSATSVTGIRYSKINNPILHALKKNKLEESASGSLSVIRATSATFVDFYGIVRTAPANELRQEREGWLFEGSSTNLILRSEEFGNASWIKSGSGTGSAPIVTSNFGVSPDGNSTADRIQLSLGGGVTSGDVSDIKQFATASSPVISIWLRSNTGSNQVVSIGYGGVIQVTVTTTWRRFEFTTSGVNQSFEVRLRGDQESSDADILVWGAQLETGMTEASSYIATTTAPVTRSADIVSVNVLDNFISSAQGDHTQVVTVKTRGTTGTSIIYEVGDGGANAAFGLSIDGPFSEYRDGSADISLSPTIDRAIENTIISITENSSMITYVNSVPGSAQAITPTATLDTTKDLYIGSNNSSTNEFNGHIQDVRVYDFALNADEVGFLSGV